MYRISYDIDMTQPTKHFTLIEQLFELNIYAEYMRNGNQACVLRIINDHFHIKQELHLHEIESPYISYTRS